MTAIVDTGPIVALLDAREPHHAWARDTLGRLETPLRTCEAVLSEVCVLLSGVKGGRSAVLTLVSRGIVAVDFRLVDELVESGNSWRSSSRTVCSRRPDASIACLPAGGCSPRDARLAQSSTGYALRESAAHLHNTGEWIMKAAIRILLSISVASVIGASPGTASARLRRRPALGALPGRHRSRDAHPSSPAPRESRGLSPAEVRRRGRGNSCAMRAPLTGLGRSARTPPEAGGGRSRNWTPLKRAMRGRAPPATPGTPSEGDPKILLLSPGVFGVPGGHFLGFSTVPAASPSLIG